MDKKRLNWLKKEMPHFRLFLVICIVDGVLNLVGQGISIWGAKILGDIATGNISKYELLCYIIIFYVTVWQTIIFALACVRKKMVLHTELKLREKIINRIFSAGKSDASVDMYINEFERAMLLYNEYFRYSIIGICSIIGSILFSGILDWRLFLISLGLGSIILIFNMLISTKMSQKANELWSKYSRANNKIRKMLKCFELIYTFPRNSLFTQDFEKMNKEIREQRDKTMTAYSKIDTVFPIVFFVFQISFLGIGFIMMKNELVTLGVVLGSLQSANIIMGNTNYLGSIFSIQQDKLTAATNIGNLLSEDSNTAIELKDNIEEVCKVTDLSYTTQNGKVLYENLSLKLCEGDFIRICGKNGTGKTTLVHSMLGLQRIEKGDIFWKKFDNEDSWEMYLEKYIGYVPQKPYIDKTGSLYENITGGNENISYEKFQKIIEKFRLEKLSKRRTIGNVSGGEMKKICIARALYKNPKILVLDEPFVNLDTYSTEKLIEQIKEQNKNGVIVILISHKNCAEFNNEIRIDLEKQ